MTEQTSSRPVPGRAVRAARAFVAAHGRPTRAVVENIGRAGARVVLVGPDGAVGDVIVADPAVGAELVARIDDLEPAEWDAETTAAAKVGPAHRGRMAGPGWRRWANLPAALRGARA